MTEHHERPADGAEPLFQNMDAKEQVYAPEQVPGNERPEADEGKLGSDDMPFSGILPVGPSGGVAGGRVAPVPPVLGDRDDENHGEPRSEP